MENPGVISRIRNLISKMLMISNKRKTPYFKKISLTVSLTFGKKVVNQMPVIVTHNIFYSNNLQYIKTEKSQVIF